MINQAAKPTNPVKFCKAKVNGTSKLMKRIILSVALIAAVAAIVVGGTMAFFSSSATSTGNTFTAGTLNLAIAKDSNGIPYNGWLTSQNASWNFSAMAPGGTPSVSSVWLKNIGTVNGMHLGVSAGNTETVGGFEKQVRITSLTLGGSNLLTGGAGATIGAYVTPTNCDVTVSGTTISAAASASANANKTVCVVPGDYNSTWEGHPEITVSQPMTIVSTQGPLFTSSIQFNITSSGVTIRGFNITNPNGTYAVQISSGISNISVKDNNINHIGTTLSSGSVQAISLTAGSSGGAHFVFSGNTITNIGNLTLVFAGSGSAKGIYIGNSADSGVISDVTIQNNIISNVQASTAAWNAGRGAYGVLVNVHGSGGYINGLVIKNNTISALEGLWSHAIGLEGNTLNAVVTYNDISNLIDHKSPSDAVGVNVEDNPSVSFVTINQNNFTPNVALGIQNTTGTDVNGQNNWWGDQDPSDQISAYVNTAGFLGGPVAGLINGTDQNANGYADLQDLRLTPITNAAVGLNASEQKQLVMGVQVDGPSTGNNFQGANLTTTLTFTLNQQ